MDQDKKQIFVRDFMTKKVISVSPDSSVAEATKIITEHSFDGLPVVDKDNYLVGILTEYDLITKTSDLSTSFLAKILSDIYASKGASSVRSEVKGISKLTVADIMNPEPLTLKDDATFEEVVDTFRQHHRVNPIPIVDDQNKIVGIVSRFDVLRPLNILSYTTRNKN